MSETKPTAGALRAAEAIVNCLFPGGEHAIGRRYLGPQPDAVIGKILPEIIDRETNLAQLEADSKKLREPATCNAGHKSNLPLALWDCPVCTLLLRDELALYKSGDHPDQIQREEEMAAKNYEPIGFCESDGTDRKLVYDRGDPSVGIAPGWQPDDNLVEDLRERERSALGKAQ